MVEIMNTGCCGINEIHNIDDAKTKPERVIWETCEAIWARGDDDGWNDPPEDGYYRNGVWIETEPSVYGDYWRNKPKSMYIFSGVISYKDKNEREEGYPTGVGENLAAYIKANKLGTVVKGPSRYNRTNHKDHKISVWVWAPSEKRLRAWWKANYEKKPNLRG